MSEKEWERNEDWIFNRQLYLMTIWSDNPDLFEMENYQKESDLIARKYGKISQEAYQQYLDDITSKRPTYRKMAVEQDGNT